ncbi:hypothetical protein LP415_22675 [Polaromonas sp. P1(28)-8]|nr:hypothetical protein LP415_22675 [Polaromonas sp. P1(28)-8]
MNMNPAGIRAAYEKNWSTATGEELQAKADVVRQIFEAMPMIPAMKRVVAGLSNYPRWGAVRPPLWALNDSAATDFFQSPRQGRI